LTKSEKIARLKLQEYVPVVRCAMKISARNVIKGKVKQVTPGAVNSEIIVEIAGGIEMVSIITKSSAERLELKPGKDVYVIVKASNVMIGTD
jgi:molybdopterin-binding protein